ncbi:MAG: right-handed parallel beta-helix repeat-containing protein [Fimbriimonadaceae bacterium]|nr:right-handed parallel beta-helix repeat-containing protein [Fimbriimonadaceae bacterium]
MPKLRRVCRCLLVLGLLWGAASAPVWRQSARPAVRPTVAAAVDHLRQPLHFEPAVDQQSYVCAGPGYRVQVTRDGLRVHLANRHRSGAAQPVAFTLRGANPAARVTASDPLAGRSNYFLGNDPRRWRTAVRHYEKVRVAAVYPGIDLVVYGTADGRVEHDFVVAPGADPSQIAFDVGGTRRQRVAADGSLRLPVPGGQVQLLQPVVYQSGPAREPVAGSFHRRDDGAWGFALGSWDRRRTLIIDPVLDYSTYLGGSNHNGLLCTALDSSGNLYVGGFTGSTDYPILDAYDNSYNGGTYDAVVSKLDPTGDLIYSTFIGGYALDDGVHRLAVTATGDVILAGITESTDFPTTVGAHDRNYNGGSIDGDGFIAKLDPSGSALVYGTYLGGSGDDVIRGLAVASDTSTWIVGASTGSFPMVGAPQASYGGGDHDGYIAHLSTDGSTLLSSTYLGTSGDDYIYGVGLDSSGNPIVGGTGGSATGWPLTPTTIGPQGGQEALVAKLAADGASFTWVTLIGGGDTDWVLDLAVDSSGNSYAVGSSASVNFPVTGGALQPTHGGGDDGLALKLNSSGSNLSYATYVGGGGGDVLNALRLRTNGTLVAVGSAISNNLSVVSAIQTTHAGGQEALIVDLNATATASSFLSFLGGNGDDVARAVDIDLSGGYYVTGFSGSSDFPVTPTAYQTTETGSPTLYTGFVSKITPGAVYTVTRAADSGAGSLREALEYCNSHAGADTIEFDIGGTGPHVIALQSTLPVITETVVIDATTQPGFVANSLNVGTNAAPQIVLDGTDLGGVYRSPVNDTGLQIEADNCEVRGLVLRNFAEIGILISGVSGTKVQSCFIGTAADGTSGAANDKGIVISNGSGNLIGAAAKTTRNLISANRVGIEISGSSGGGNKVFGNLIGTTAPGDAALGNLDNGIAISGSPNNEIGGINAGEGNVIAASSSTWATGVSIGGSTASGNKLRGNRIGTNAAGTAALPIRYVGVDVNNAPNNLIGDSVSGGGNLISGCLGEGLIITQAGATGNQVLGNTIGLNLAGDADLGNGGTGVNLNQSSSGTVVGGSGLARNVIAGNEGHGCWLNSGTNNNTIQGNLIGLRADGTAAIANSGHGIRIEQSSTNTTIGGALAAQRNVISGNGVDGVHIDNSADITLEGNYIGLNAVGDAAIGNGDSGVYLVSASDRCILRNNTISGNINHKGIRWEGGDDGQILGNRIGTNAAGTAALPNALGVWVSGGTNLLLGDHTAGSGNLISGNTGDAVTISASGACVYNNLIGLAADGTTALANDGAGLLVTGGATGAKIGGTGSLEANRIAYNTGDGVSVAPAGATPSGIEIRGNRIFGNTGLGIDLDPDGVNYNDLGDGDSGANQQLNFPVLTHAWVDGSGLNAEGDLDVPGGAYPVQVDVYSNPAADPSGYGEGEVFCGSTTVASGSRFAVGALPNSSVGQTITVVATDLNGNSSEFGAALPARATAPNVVTTTADSGRGSLREAIDWCNATAGTQTITFAINGTGPHSIVPASNLPAVTDPVVVDGYSQAGASPNTQASGTNAVWMIVLDGRNVSAGGSGLHLGADGCSVRGLAFENWTSYGVDVRADNGTVAGCRFGSSGRSNATALRFYNAVGGTAGGTTLASRNLVGYSTTAGVSVDGCSDVVVQGNLLGTDAAGSTANANSIGLLVTNTSAHAVLRNNVISGNTTGVRLTGAYTTGNQLLGNRIGTTAAGTAALGNGTGIEVSAQAHNNEIGGPGGGDGNLISGNSGHGLTIQTCTGTLVQNNGLGVGAGGIALGNGGDGVALSQSAANSAIGGTGTNEGNQIANNTGAGVRLLADAGNGNQIVGNRITANGGLGIDLDPSGANFNDTDDSDGGPNQRQNFPVLDAAYDRGPSGTLLQYTIDSPSTQTTYPVQLEVFQNDSAHWSGFGEGQTFLTRLAVNAPGSYNASLPQLAAGTRLSATVTDANGNTSEFAHGIEVIGQPAALVYTQQPTNVVAGNAIAPAVTVELRDLNDRLVAVDSSSVTLTRGAGPNGSSLGGTTSVNAVNGVATFDNLLLPQAGAGYTLLASAGPLGPTASSPFNVTPGAPAALSFGQQPTDQLATVALQPAVTVRIEDAHGNLCATATDPVSVSLTGGGGGALSGTLTRNAVNGVATFDDLSVDLVGSSYQLLAGSGGLTGASSALFAILPGNAARLVIVNEPGPGLVGQPLAPALEVEIHDAGGNLAAGATDNVNVVLGNNPSGATLGGTVTKAAVGGRVVFDNLLLNRPGSGYTLNARAAGAVGATSNGFDITAVDPTHLVFTTEPTDVVSGQVMLPAVVVEGRDDSDTVLGDHLVTLTLGNNPAGARLGGTVSRRLVNGVATFDNLRLDLAGAGVTLTASASGLAPAESAAFEVLPGSGQRLRFLNSPASATADDILETVQVEVVDAFDNRVTGQSGDVSLRLDSSTVPLQGTVTRPLVSGVATFDDLAVYKAQAGFVLEALAGGLTPTLSAAFDIGPGAVDPDRSTFRAAPTVLPADATAVADLLVQALDAHDNPLQNLPAAALSLTNGDGLGPADGFFVDLPTTPGDASGRLRAGARSAHPRVVQLTATVHGVALTTLVDLTFQPRRPDPSKCLVALDPPQVAADGSETAVLTVTLRDAADQPVDGLPVELRDLQIDGPADGVQLVDAGQDSDAAGVYRVTLAVVTAGRYLLTPRVGATALSSVTLTGRLWADLVLPAGLTFRALPLQPDLERLRDLFVEPGLQVAWYDTPARTYRSLSLPDLSSRSVLPAWQLAGAGLWFRSDRDRVLRITGDPWPDAPLTLRLAPGWNSCANPYDGLLGWALADIEVLQDGDPIGTLADEALWDTTVRPYGWTWGPGGYALVFDPARPGFEGVVGELAPYQGIWLQARATGISLRLPPPAAGRTRAKALAGTLRDWTVNLRATAGAQQSGAVVGLSSRLTRALPLVEPPAVEAGGGLSLRLLDPVEGRLAGMLQTSAGNRWQWRAEVSGTTGEAVTLSWPSLLRELPRGVQLELRDLVSGRVTALNARGAYTWQPAGAGETRSFELTARIGNLNRATIGSLTVSAARGGGALLSLVLSDAAEVVVTVRGLGGRVVRQFSRPVPAGPVSLGWDGLDQDGRRVPRGSYLVEALASSANGAQSRASRTVTIQ